MDNDTEGTFEKIGQALQALLDLQLPARSMGDERVYRDRDQALEVTRRAIEKCGSPSTE